MRKLHIYRNTRPISISSAKTSRNLLKIEANGEAAAAKTITRSHAIIIKWTDNENSFPMSHSLAHKCIWCAYNVIITGPAEARNERDRREANERDAFYAFICYYFM